MVVIICKKKDRHIYMKKALTNYREPCVSAYVSSRWTFGQRLDRRQCTEMVSLLCGCKKRKASHGFYVPFSSGYKYIFTWSTHLLMCCWRSKFFEKILSQKLHFSFGPLPFSCSAEENVIAVRWITKHYGKSSLFERKDVFKHLPVDPSEFFLLLRDRLGMMTFSKLPSSVRLVVMLQVLVLVACFPGL